MENMKLVICKCEAGYDKNDEPMKDYILTNKPELINDTMYDFLDQQEQSLYPAEFVKYIQENGGIAFLLEPTVFTYL